MSIMNSNSPPTDTSSRPRVLLVDDEPRNLAVLEAYLAPQGYELVRAQGGREALEVFERAPPDIILLDVLMPELDGIDVLTHIRAQDRPERIPVILVTGQTEREDRLRGFEAGADEFLEKPVDRALLLTRVRTLLRLKAAGDEVVRRNALLEALRREQRELTEFLVHDLKNPLSVVHMNLGWLAQTIGADRSDIHEALVDSTEASSRIQTMLEDLIAVSRIEQANAPLSRADVDVGEIIDDLGRAHSREAQAKGLSLRVHADPGLVVPADPAILRRVLENLLRNALQYTPADGRISISAKGGAEVEIAVSNTGQPILAEERGRIFEKFRRGASAATKGGNVGLGLYFCKRAMEAHGGDIAVTQSPGWPISFVLRLPVS
jgi:two-component system sensor histidine kinase/response regulator